MKNQTKKEMFLGYLATSYHIYYCDMYTKLVKTYKHVQFDKGMNDLEIYSKCQTTEDCLEQATARRSGSCINNHSTNPRLSTNTIPHDK